MCLKEDLLESLEGEGGVVSFLTGREFLEGGEAGVVEAEVIAPLRVRPALLDLIHGPHLVDVLSQLVPHLLDVGCQLDLEQCRKKEPLLRQHLKHIKQYLSNSTVCAAIN